jgi:hypothetical protein
MSLREDLRRKEAFEQAIRRNWPGIGNAAVKELAAALARTPRIGLSDFVFSDNEYPADHRLYCLCRYLIPL